jgi:hypothetical protein
MYDADKDFREALNLTMPDLPDVRDNEGSEAVGRRLEAALLELLGEQQQQQQGQQQAAVAGGGS